MQNSAIELAELFLPILNEKGISTDINYTEKVVALIKERAIFVTDFWELSNFFFEAPSEYDEKAAKKNWKPETNSLMKELVEVLITIDDFTSQNIETIVKEWITAKEIGFGIVMQPFRLSLVGAMKGPHLFDIAEMIGKSATLERIHKAINTL